jgi:hypothetical protein
MGTTIEDLEQRRTLHREELACVGDFRLGSLIYRYRRCGKPGCPCADPTHPGHGGLGDLQEGWGEDSDEYRAPGGVVAHGQTAT